MPNSDRNGNLKHADNDGCIKLLQIAVSLGQSGISIVVYRLQFVGLPPMLISLIYNHNILLVKRQL